MTPLRLTAPLALLALSSLTPAQDQQVLERLGKLESENAELRRRFDLLASERSDFDLGAVFAGLGDGVNGLSPAASKVYGRDAGLSIGGYGEATYQNYAGSKTDTADFLRAVLYFGYRFNESWLFNSEIEFEHASTGKSGEASVEFAFIEYAGCEDMAVRGGLLLTPMGFINELHEPQTFLGATRPETERRIIPSTWREMGVGVVGDAGPISYRAYVMNGFDAMGFSDAGLRGGRQKGSKAKSEDLAVVLRADWTDTPGLLAGGSIYYGDSGQDQAGLGDTGTTIFEAHAEYRSRGLWARGLYAMATVDDVMELNTALGYGATESVGEELSGGYLELGYDVLSGRPSKGKGKGGEGTSLSPFLRYEVLDTQADVPTGFTADPTNDFDVVTVGLAYQPFDNVVLKLDFQDFEHDFDRVNVTLGYAF